jgi:hypothetical protein
VVEKPLFRLEKPAHYRANLRPGGTASADTGQGFVVIWQGASAPVVHYQQKVCTMLAMI